MNFDLVHNIKCYLVGQSSEPNVVCKPEVVHILITDSDIDPNIHQALVKKGIKVMIAGTSSHGSQSFRSK